MAGANGNGTAGERLVGRVTSVNERGLRLEGRDGWLNVSKWAKDVHLPERGARVVVKLDGAGFVRAIAPADGAAVSTHVDKDQTITRLAVLKAAAEFAASRPDLKSGDVLAIAERWERWVLREEG